MLLTMLLLMVYAVFGIRYSTGYISIEEARANWWAGAAALVVALCAFSDLVVTFSWQLQGNPHVLVV